MHDASYNVLSMRFFSNKPNLLKLFSGRLIVRIISRHYNSNNKVSLMSPPNPRNAFS